MKKRILFYAFSVFVLFFTMAAWSFATEELAQLEEKNENPKEMKSI